MNRDIIAVILIPVGESFNKKYIAFKCNIDILISILSNHFRIDYRSLASTKPMKKKVLGEL